MPPLLSFIIPAFNAEHTIDDAVRSVLSQSRAEIELIVVDDGSTDSTFARASAIADPRVRVVRRTNRGVAASRNLGLVLAQGDFVCFLDADDMVLPEFASASLGAIGECDAISTAYRDTDPSRNPSSQAWYPALSELRLDRLRISNPLSIGATIFRTDGLREVTRHFGDAFPSDCQVEDWELLLRFTSLGARWAEPIQTPLMLCRLTPGSRSAQSRTVWQDGRALIDRWVPARERASALRTWTLSQFARALANDEAEFAAHLSHEVGSLTDTDIPTLVGSLRVWATRQRTVTGQRVGFSHLRSRIARAAPVFADRIASEALRPSWDELALLASNSLAPHEAIVVYGFGRNGREASRALSRAGITHKIIDDDPGFQSPLRTTVAELCPNHVILLTPDRRVELLAKLRSVRASRILTPEMIHPASADAA